MTNLSVCEFRERFDKFSIYVTPIKRLAASQLSCSFALHEQPFSLNFFCHVQIHISIELLECCIVLFDRAWAYSYSQNDFFIPVNCM